MAFCTVRYSVEEYLSGLRCIISRLLHGGMPLTEKANMLAESSIFQLYAEGDEVSGQV
jgi:hypothetical protein